MKTRYLGYLLVALIVAPVVVAGPLATTGGCSGADCPFPIRGVATDPDVNEAESEAVRRCNDSCTEATCMDIGSNPSLRCEGSYCLESQPRCIYNGGWYDTNAGVHVAFAYGECLCTSCGGQPVAVGPRVEPTVSQKIQNTYNNVKQSIFKRLFGRK